MLVARNDQIYLCSHSASDNVVIVWIVFYHAGNIVWSDYVCHASQFPDDVQRC